MTADAASEARPGEERVATPSAIPRTVFVVASVALAIGLGVRALATLGAIADTGPLFHKVTTALTVVGGLVAFVAFVILDSS